MNKILGILSISRKAGKLKYGKDVVLEALGKGEVRLVIFASDLSERSRSEVERAISLAEDPPPTVKLELTMYEISRILNKVSGILAVCDEGLAKQIILLAKPECVEENI